MNMRVILHITQICFLYILRRVMIVVGHKKHAIGHCGLKNKKKFIVKRVKNEKKP